MSKIGTKIIVEEIYPLSMPKKANTDDAAYDLVTRGDFKVTQNKRVFIPLGFKIQLPTNMCLIIQPRSGQSGKGMIATIKAPSWLHTCWKSSIRIDADVIIGLIDSGYCEEVHAIVKFGRFTLRQKILRLLGFKFYIADNSRICQGRFVYVPNISLSKGLVVGNRCGLGSTDK